MNMQKRLWLDVAVAATVLVCAFLVWLDAALDAASSGRTVAAVTALAAFALSYAAFGRWLIPVRHPAADALYLAIMVATVGFGCAADPNLAILQAVAYPLIGGFSPWGRVGMIAWDAVLALAVFAGLALSRVGIAGAAITAVLSFLFAVAIGLWIGRVMQWGTERARLLSELQVAQQQAAVSEREAGAARERERLARDMHDTVAQSLTGLVMLAERAERQASRRGSAGELGETLATIEQAARETLREIRALVAESASQSVDDGLGEAAHRVAARFERETGIGVTVRFDEVALAREQEVVLLRCFQEALANVRKHARANTVSADLHATGDTVTLVVTDDGIGPGGRTRLGDGFGLAGMQDRLHTLGGSVRLSAAARRGARLTAVIPRAMEPVSGPAGSETRAASDGGAR